MRPIQTVVFPILIATAHNAQAADCPAGQLRPDTAVEGPSESDGVEVVDGPAVALERSTGLRGVLQYRRVTIAPGGTLELHAHDEMPGFAYVLTGVATEHRSDCAVPITRTGGDIATEPDTLTHWWVNEGETPMVLIVSHVVRDAAGAK